MSRLIDADAITRTKKLNNKIKVIDMTPYISLEDLIEFIDNLPTVYDVEKVVAELEERKQLHNDMIAYEQKNGTVTEEYQARKAVEVLDKAIEIARKGGVE